MAVAARPGPSDARVPCPLCGGLIHPIAGKCKHCKADLTSYHAARPAANTPLPALFQAASGHTPPAVLAGAPGHADAAAAVPVPVAAGVAARYEASQPVLPPRPPTRSFPSAPQPSGWRSWPVVVIAIAMVAIVVAVVLMVWPAGRRDVGSKRTLSPPPAPERMQTEPEINTPAPPAAKPRVPPASDPWSQAPQRAPDVGAQADPNDPDDSDVDLDAHDPFSAPHPSPALPGHRRPSGALGMGGSGLGWFAMAQHFCRKMIQCGADNPVTRSMCDQLAHRPPVQAGNCPTAKACLDHIDTMSCQLQGDDLSQLTQLLVQFSDCAEAARC